MVVQIEVGIEMMIVIMSVVGIVVMIVVGIVMWITSIMRCCKGSCHDEQKSYEDDNSFHVSGRAL